MIQISCAERPQAFLPDDDSVCCYWSLQTTLAIHQLHHIIVSEQISIEVPSSFSRDLFDPLSTHLGLCVWTRTPNLLGTRIRRLLFFIILAAVSLLILSTSTIVEITNITAIEEFLPETLIDFVVYVTCPGRCCASRRHLRRELVYDLMEVLCTFSTRVEPDEEMDVAFQRCLFVLAGCVGVASHDGVEELPCTPPELRFSCGVSKLRHDGVA